MIIAHVMRIISVSKSKFVMEFSPDRSGEQRRRARWANDRTMVSSRKTIEKN